MSNDIEKITITVMAQRLDSFRIIEERARRQWRSALVRLGDYWVDAGFELAGSESDPVLTDQVIYEFVGVALDSHAVTSPGAQA